MPYLSVPFPFCPHLGKYKIRSCRNGDKRSKQKAAFCRCHFFMLRFRSCAWKVKGTISTGMRKGCQ
ncbi:hypothetical protein I3760_13G132400 [Carya illinoinensis]|nr:hypothetical protein I3760_13G132400 [Carya illinoinensis]